MAKCVAVRQCCWEWVLFKMPIVKVEGRLQLYAIWGKGEVVVLYLKPFIHTKHCKHLHNNHFYRIVAEWETNCLTWLWLCRGSPWTEEVRTFIVSSCQCLFFAGKCDTWKLLDSKSTLLYLPASVSFSLLPGETCNVKLYLTSTKSLDINNIKTGGVHCIPATVETTSSWLGMIIV